MRTILPRPILLCALLLTGCGGLNDETQLLELRVLSMLPAAPEIAPGETTDLDVLVVDPTAAGSRVLVWTCTSTGEGCLEDQTANTVQTPDAGHVHVNVTAPAPLAYVASETPLPIVFVWALACVDGACPVLDDVDAGRAVDADFWESPLDTMADLPLQGTSLAFTAVSVSTRSADTRHVNPTLTVDPGAASAAPGAELPMAATVVGELGESPALWGYSEAGGFTATDTALADDGTAELTWVAPDEAGATTGYIVLVDDLGGGALWEGTLTAE